MSERREVQFVLRSWREQAPAAQLVVWMDCGKSGRKLPHSKGFCGQIFEERMK